MNIVVFSTKNYDRNALTAANGRFGHKLHFLEHRLTHDSAQLAQGFDAVCVFVNDIVDGETLRALSSLGIKAIALRCAGFNNVDLATAAELNIPVVRVPAYSPHAVAEHTLGLILMLNRKLNRAYTRVREGNFSLEGLLGFDLFGKTAGVVGTGKIGCVAANLLAGFGMHVLAYDVAKNPDCRADYVPLETLFAESDIITLHCPLTPDTKRVVNEKSIARMRRGVMLINTSRGGLLDTKAVIAALKSGRIGYLGLDVYDQESDLFFEDLSNTIIQDDVFQRLLTFPNVVITGHQAFFTAEALDNIATTTLGNLAMLEQGQSCPNLVTTAMIVGSPRGSSPGVQTKGTCNSHQPKSR